MIHNYIHYLHGIWMQCSGNRRVPDYRFAERTSDCHDHKQLCPLQWAFPYLNCHFIHVFCGSIRRVNPVGRIGVVADHFDFCSAFS